jgi:serine O-acetyltransferase|tara:strand:- start:846 stop:1514 length:669 start_codon:yes stop_codon:yes gene_type:complete
MTRVISSLSPADLAAYVAAQLNSHFPDRQAVTADHLMPVMPGALARLEHCFAQVDNKYFFDGTQAVFNHLHGDQYAMWLYFLSNELFRQGGDAAICSKLFLLNKSLHACDIFYEVALPDVFLLVHPLGTVLGRGSYSDYFVAYQRCGVGSNRDIYPQFGRHVTLRPGAAVLGKSQIGNNCQIAAETLILDTDIPDGTLVMGRPGQIRQKTNAAPYPLWRVST